MEPYLRQYECCKCKVKHYYPTDDDTVKECIIITYEKDSIKECKGQLIATVMQPYLNNEE